ncbi:hypothetical protein [Nitrosopumilus sp.]|uniref:hypothetical protein n=1 Tax=Nitrosopumilus sp. TaxID=2024843 RepID=UPI003B59ABAC
MPPLDMILLIVSLVSMVGLPFAIGGSLQSGRMQRVRIEENAVRFLTILGIAVVNGIVISPLVPQVIVDVKPLDTVLTVALAGICGAVSWKTFSWGIKRGEELFSDDLYSMREHLEQTVAIIKETAASMREDHKQDANSIQDMVTEFASNLKMDETVSNFLQRTVKQEIEDVHVPQISRYCNETLDMCRINNNELVDRIEKLLERTDNDNENAKTTTSSSPVSEYMQTPQETEIKAEIKEEEQQRQIPTGPTDIQKSQKILEMTSIRLAEYKPKHHKICIVMHNLIKNRQDTDNKSYRPSLSDIAGISGVNKADAKVRLQNLANMGLVSISPSKTSSRIEHSISDKLEKLFNPTLENQREGGMESFFLIQEAKKHHLDHGRYFEILKQDITIEQPDAISIPTLDNESFDVANGIAIEIESPQEIRAHPEQVKSNMAKNLQWFSKVEVWCYEDTQDKIQRILDSIDPEYWNKITIMSVHQHGSSA